MNYKTEIKTIADKMTKRRVLEYAGQLSTLFLVATIGKVFWWCIMNHTGTLTNWGTEWVGDQLWILLIEFVLITPFSIYWIIRGHKGERK